MADVLGAKDAEHGAEQSSRPEADDIKLEEEQDLEAPAVPAVASGSPSAALSSPQDSTSPSSPSSPSSISPPSTSISTSTSPPSTSISPSATSLPTSPSGSSPPASSESPPTSNQPNTAQDQAQEADDDDSSDDGFFLGPEYFFDYEKTPRRPDSPPATDSATVPITVYAPRSPSPPRTTDFQPIPVNATTLGRPYTAPSLSTREPEYKPVPVSGSGLPIHSRASSSNRPLSSIPELLGPAGPTHDLIVVINPQTGRPAFRARPISANDAARILRNLPALDPPLPALDPPLPALEEPESDPEASETPASNTTVPDTESDTETPKIPAGNTTVTDTKPSAGPSKTSIPPGASSPPKK